MIMTQYTSKALHPFFDAEQRRKAHDEPDSQPTEQRENVELVQDAASSAPEAVKQPQDAALNPDAKPKRRGRPPNPRESLTGADGGLEVDPNVDRRKKRKTSPSFDSPWSAAASVAARQHAPSAEVCETEEAEATAQPDTSGIPVGRHDTPKTAAASSVAESSKQLKLNGKGGFGSPAKKKSTKRNELLVVVRYGQEDTAGRVLVGQRINDILSGLQRMTVPISSKGRNKQKPKHPFFSGKPEKTATKPLVKEAQLVYTSATPGKYRAQFQSLHPAAIPNVADFHATPKPKAIGGTDAMWTCREFIRAEHDVAILFKHSMPASTDGPQHARRRRMKERQENVSHSDGIVEHAINLQAGVSTVAKTRQRHQITGKDVLQHVQQRLDVPQKRPSAVKHILESLPARRSAFDDAECEQILWAHKYAPHSAEEVLCVGKEPRVLRKWLESLAVSAVQTMQETIPKDRKQIKRKKAYGDEFDDFIAGADDGDEMYDLETSEEVLNLVSWKGSVVRREYKTTANTVVISGPHGCGKTAMAYAVAKQLGFEVFELNSSGRRSGRDIYDRVGDLARNHQVRKAQVSSEEVVEKLPDTAAADQHTLGNFFKSGSQGSEAKKVSDIKQASIKPKPAAKPSVADDAKTAAGVQSKKQKQSLVLLEEADVLFQDDKQFWETVIEFALGSKRPVIITCSDETKIPLPSLSLHAVLRLQPQPTELLVDYCLGVAACEGHLLERQPLEQLVQSCCGDLRASLNELNFWCQMAVGDEKAGMDWFPRRWPPGVDTNTYGQRLRICSSDTFALQDGWSVLGRHDSKDHAHFEVLQYLQEQDVSPVALGHHDLVAQTERELPSQNQSRNLAALRLYSSKLDALLTIDELSSSDIPGTDSRRDRLDLTLPLLTDKDKLSYSISEPLLQASLEYDYTSLSAQITASIALLTCFSDEPGNEFGRLRRPDPSPLLSQPALEANVYRPRQATVDQDNGVFSSHRAQTLASDVLPYLRSIALTDVEVERSLMRDRTSKKPRLTRTARSAVDGGVRSMIRRARWLPATWSLESILQSGGPDWAPALSRHDNDYLSSQDYDEKPSSQDMTDELA